MSYLLAGHRASIVTDPDGKTYVLPGLPIIVHAADQAASSSALFTDTDTVFSATLAPGSRTLAPVRVDDAETFFAPSIAAEVPGHGTNHVRPNAVTDADTIFACGIGASVKPALATDSDAIYAAAIDNRKGQHRCQARSRSDQRSLRTAAACGRARRV
jgi:hypothetical protein